MITLIKLKNLSNIMGTIDLIEYFVTYASYAGTIVFSILLFKKKVPKSIKTNAYNRNKYKGW